ncbi:uncharacterized protein LOC107491346 [Arachis duranensis]|uniref:Uncharacterized protein LOC107491346 n=1 Tax=Arachis duranensis TaxID=130453 RepID=A0A6P4DFU1_ARADU|nr:uncharacterized protein LOC107491346 [Arachis duranensis]XP_015967677.1 uncharacterized protein LOC107491346 [Arachis duranensis]XP_052118184.1 uncharacterized protein LOC107491346 [Arachis duranensis]XP_052118185.1 uncharacterized protein LOC107491346 [Arachis duranensis]
MGRVSGAEKQEFSEMENAEFSDLQLICHVRDALSAVTLGDRENYDELVGYLHRKESLNPDDIALLETTLKALSGTVSCIDSVHHESLLSAVYRMSLWNYGTSIMDALIELIVSLAASNGKYIDWSLELLVNNFTPPYHLMDSLKQESGIEKKNKVLSRVHAAFEAIAVLVPLAPLRLSPMVVQRMPLIYSKGPEILMYVENMLKLESGAIGEIVGVTMLPAIVDRLIELDVEIGWDGLLQEDAKGIFEMELEDAEFADGDGDDNMPAAEYLNRKTLEGNTIAEKLDSLIELTFLHLESCQSSGRLSEVFDVLLRSFQRTILNAYKAKFTQFVVFYACALDPEDCGVKFAMVLTDMFLSNVNPPNTRMSAVAYLASYLSRAKFVSAALVASILQRLVDWCLNYCQSHDSVMNPRAHQVFYSGCQALMYMLCFRMRSLMDAPRLKMQLLNMPMEPILQHKLNSLKVCLPTVVVEFLRQAKAAKLFMTSESFAFDDMLESDLSRAFGGIDRLDAFFPFDPCLLKKSESYIRPHFARWSKIKCDGANDGDLSESGSDASDDEFVDMNENDMIEDDMTVSVQAGLDFDPDLNRMSITPKNKFLLHFQQQNARMPARIRPSTSPESL